MFNSRIENSFLRHCVGKKIKNIVEFFYTLFILNLLYDDDFVKFIKIDDKLLSAFVITNNN